MSNLKVYNDPVVVEYYKQESALQPAEAAILLEWKKIPFIKNMLDLGVGAGRTTPHFSPLAHSYAGVDIAPNMIAACKEKYPNHLFVVANASKLLFKDNSFDAILFSYNGIDYLDRIGRIQALQEIKRVAKQSARFAFSSHNLLAWPADKILQPASSVTEWLRSLKRWLILSMRNNIREIHDIPYAIIRGDGDSWKSATYYGKPAHLVNELAELDIKVLAMYGLTGEQLTLKDDLARESWIYYDCAIKKTALQDDTTEQEFP